MKTKIITRLRHQRKILSAKRLAHAKQLCINITDDEKISNNKLYVKYINLTPTNYFETIPLPVQIH